MIKVQQLMRARPAIRRAPARQPVVVPPTREMDMTGKRAGLRAEWDPLASLTSIGGIGEGRARRLARIGIDSIEKLAGAASAKVARVMKVVLVPIAVRFIGEPKRLFASRELP